MIKANKQVLDRFELEQQIMQCWQVVDDLKTICEMVPDESQDDVKTAIMGLGLLYDQKFTKLFDTFAALVANKKIS